MDNSAKDAPPSLKREKKKRPDGTDADRYKNMESWTFKRWAWEFLRRNPDYREACALVESGTNEEKQAAAKKFGLRKFKHWNERSNSKLGYPKFSANPNRCWINVDRASRNQSIRIDRGQVVFLFDLTSEINGEKSLAHQLSDAKDVLGVQLQRYVEKNPEIGKKEMEETSPQPRTLHFGCYIRIFDCLDSGMSKADCARVVFQSRAEEGLTEAELEKLLEDPILAGKKLMKETYLHLSKSSRRPNSNKKITTTR